jgi:hypothetical protein
MKFGVRVLIALCTFILGVVVSALWHVMPWVNSSSQVATTKQVFFVPEANSPGTGCWRSRITSLSLCDLFNNTDRYEGRVVRVEGFLHQGVGVSVLDDSTCNASIVVSCGAGDEACTMLQRSLSDESPKVRVEVIGRYHTDSDFPNASHSNLEILRVMDVKPVFDGESHANPSQ